jgi:hypothetical protein
MMSITHNGPDESGDAEGKKHSGWSIALLLAAAFLAIAPVAGFGWYQFADRAQRPIDIVKAHKIPGSDSDIGDGILDFVKGKGVKVVSEGFKPSWGAEETGSGVWVVSYVFEVGRESRRLSWQVYPKSGRVLPKDALASELWGATP